MPGPGDPEKGMLGLVPASPRPPGNSRSPRMEYYATETTQSRLSERRKEKLLNLKRREEMKDVLLAKMKVLFTKADGSRSITSSAIASETDRFLGNAKITEPNLNRLQRRVAKNAKAKKARGDDEDAASVAGTEVSAYSQMSGRSGASTGRSGVLVGAGKSGMATAPGLEPVKEEEPTADPVVAARANGLSPVERAPGAPPADVAALLAAAETPRESFDWQRLDEYAKYCHEQDEVRRKSGILDMRKSLQIDLDKQVAEKRLKKERQREAERTWYLNTLLDVEEWKETEKQKVDEIKAKAAKEKEDRDEQLAQEHAVRAEEKRKRFAEEKALVAKIEQEMKAEKEKIERKKVEQKRAFMKVFEDNKAEQIVRDAEKAKQVKADIEAMHEYNRMVERQEKARADELQARNDRAAQFSEQMKKLALKQEEAKGAFFADRAEREQAERDQRSLETERNKAEKLRNMCLETQEFLFKQMSEKREKNRQDQEMKKVRAAIMEAEKKEYTDGEEKKVLEKRQFAVENRRLLVEQIEEKKSRKASEMSGGEMRMNKKLLDLVDKTLAERDQKAAEAMSQRSEAVSLEEADAAKTE